MFVKSFEGDVSMVVKNSITTKHGQPKVGQKNARKMTRAECELTDLPRWVKIYTSPATGETAFKNADIVGGAKTVYAIRKKLSKFWG
jgi:hypothetical protein